MLTVVYIALSVRRYSIHATPMTFLPVDSMSDRFALATSRHGCIYNLCDDEIYSPYKQKGSPPSHNCSTILSRAAAAVAGPLDFAPCMGGGGRRRHGPITVLDGPPGCRCSVCLDRPKAIGGRLIVAGSGTSRGQMWHTLMLAAGSPSFQTL